MPLIVRAPSGLSLRLSAARQPGRGLALSSSHTHGPHSLTTERASNCTDIPPDSNFTCYQQATEFNKCDADFMFLYSYCLKSCNRCGGEQMAGVGRAHLGVVWGGWRRRGRLGEVGAAREDPASRQGGPGKLWKPWGLPGVLAYRGTPPAGALPRSTSPHPHVGRCMRGCATLGRHVLGGPMRQRRGDGRTVLPEDLQPLQHRLRVTMIKPVAARRRSSVAKGATPSPNRWGLALPNRFPRCRFKSYARQGAGVCMRL